MNRLKLKSNFIPPINYIHENFYLEILMPKHNMLDFDAWSSSVQSLRNVLGPRNPWPLDVANLEDNLKDLEKHYFEYKDKIAFAYTILNPTQDRCIGCLYIRPPKCSKFDAHIDFWFRDDHLHMEYKFYIWLKNWLFDYWKFVAPVFPGRSIEWNEYYLL